MAESAKATSTPKGCRLVSIANITATQNQLSSKRIRTAWIIVFTLVELLGFIPILGVFGLLPNRGFGKNFWPMAAILWGALCLFTGSCVQSLRCPRCEQNYFDIAALFGSYDGPTSLFKKECVNCGRIAKSQVTNT